MPGLPLPLGLTGLNGGDLVVTTDADVETVLASFLKPGDSTIVRDAITAALFAMLSTYQLRAERANVLCDITRSVGAHLIAVCQERGVYAADDESDTSLRARGIAGELSVTPEAILAAINVILAPFTTVQAAYCESILDRWYIGSQAPLDGSGPTPWHSFVWSAAASRDPQYPDRLYADDIASNGGFVIAGRRPGGARIFSSEGRTFFIRIPDLSALDGNGAFAYAAAADPSNANRWFLASSTTAGNEVLVSGVRSIPGTMATIFEAIVSTVTRLKGQGIAYTIYADPKWNG